ncbi:MAG TPA: DUF4097 family beta strand repeat-containing protein [Longimicrobiaceae bacterium]|nr:DUF4097 family beta strand repeat-containing protein [Longimicrobiaceae bacterium]
MLATIAGGALAAVLAAAPQTDTTFTVQPNARLEVRNTGGDITVRTWDRNAVRIEAEHSSRTEVDVENTGAVVRVQARSRYGPANIVDYRITVPASMSLDLSGMHAEIDVQGVQGEVSAQSVQGDVTVRGGRGNVNVRTVQGEVLVEGAQGQVRGGSTSGDVRVVGSTGEIYAETVSGAIYLERITSGRVEAGTVSGDVYYDGTVQPRGRYSFVTHSGDVVASIPDGADAAVSVATLSGDVEASFALPARDGDRGRRFSYVLGSGSAKVELETFSGDVHLRRPGEVSAQLTAARARQEERDRARRQARQERERARPAPAPRPTTP